MLIMEILLRLITFNFCLVLSSFTNKIITGYQGANPRLQNLHCFKANLSLYLDSALTNSPQVTLTLNS